MEWNSVCGKKNAAQPNTHEHLRETKTSNHGSSFHFLLCWLITWLLTRITWSAVCVFSSGSSGVKMSIWAGASRKEGRDSGEKKKFLPGEKTLSTGREVSRVQRRCVCFVTLCWPLTSEQHREASVTGGQCTGFLNMTIQQTRIVLTAELNTRGRLFHGHAATQAKTKQVLLLRFPHYCISSQVSIRNFKHLCTNTNS